MNLRTLVLLALLPGTAACAQMTLPRVLSSHMVVQRDLPVHVWGKAAPGEAISVSFRGETSTTTTGPLGKWSVYLKPGAAGGPFALTVTGTPASGAPQTVALEDVLVGDVWVASGQSNMEFAMREAATADQDLPHAANDHIRLLKVKHKAIDYPLDDVETEGWAASTPETAKNFSAVAWYFARRSNSGNSAGGGDRLHLGRHGGRRVDAEAALGADAR